MAERGCDGAVLPRMRGPNPLPLWTQTGGDAIHDLTLWQTFYAAPEHHAEMRERFERQMRERRSDSMDDLRGSRGRRIG